MTRRRLGEPTLGAARACSCLLEGLALLVLALAVALTLGVCVFAFVVAFTCLAVCILFISSFIVELFSFTFVVPSVLAFRIFLSSFFHRSPYGVYLHW